MVDHHRDTTFGSTMDAVSTLMSQKGEDPTLRNDRYQPQKDVRQSTYKKDLRKKLPKTDVKIGEFKKSIEREIEKADAKQANEKNMDAYRLKSITMNTED